MSTPRPMVRNLAAKNCVGQPLTIQHAEAQSRIAAYLSQEAVRERWPVCQCAVPVRTGRWYAAVPGAIAQEACRLCELAIQLFRARAR